MSLQRSLSWSSALRDLKDDGKRRPAGALGAQASITFKARTRPLVAPTGAYDRAAIMAAAVFAAKTHQLTYGSTWGVAMSLALKSTWAAAKAARARTAH
ncbi:hypothetical protein Q8W71_32090 [Methylobacterium sp. NEAU 140]|uniref:hypothetical protein n=1 Tax=Methylobacterium sp. NEAU 140 TaxID=3064945 RepID=UPI0027372A55|nr:hypothetical protein [Methylobacterium sp. NEAU 140]MDP4027216.1 hypothetical protein [Methylobacterium sp. NEAU 140]